MAHHQGENLEKWQKLCAEAATEQNPQRLMELITEIDRMLNEKEQRLTSRRKEKGQGAT